MLPENGKNQRDRHPDEECERTSELGDVIGCPSTTYSRVQGVPPAVFIPY